MKLCLHKILVLLFTLVFQTLSGQGDGRFVSFSTLQNSGPISDKFNIVFMGDGFTTSQQEQYNEAVNSILQTLNQTHPYKYFREAFNFYRMNIASRETGMDMPDSCNQTPTGFPRINARTALNAKAVCNETFIRFVDVEEDSVRRYLETYTDFTLGTHNLLVYVIVNHRWPLGIYSYTSKIGIGTNSRLMSNTFIHEFGHAFSNLRDEYAEAEGRNFSSSHNVSVNNITNQTDRNLIQWKNLILPSTPIPTSTCRGSVGSDLPDDIIGLFEGAGTYHCGIYRSQKNCVMRNSDHTDMCSMCQKITLFKLKTFVRSSYGIKLNTLKIKNIHEPWYKGQGDIALECKLDYHSTIRWPETGHVSYRKNETKLLEGMPIGSVGDNIHNDMHVKITEFDNSDPDDVLEKEGTFRIRTPGPFIIDSDDWELTGVVEQGNLKILLDNLYIKYDRSRFPSRKIYVTYQISNDDITINGRWPFIGTVDFTPNLSQKMRGLAGQIPIPNSSDKALTIKFRVYAIEPGFRNSSKLMEENTFSFSHMNQFGTMDIVHVKDMANYRLVLSIVQCD